MRISYIALTSTPNFTYLNSFVSKIDQRIALIAIGIIAAIGIGVCVALLYMKRLAFTANPEPDQKIPNPHLEKKAGSPKPEKKTESPELEKLDAGILELQNKYPGAQILTEQDMIKASKEKKTWIILHSKVYDVTKFLDEHPGGEEVLLDYSGRDASRDFDDIGHSDEAQKLKEGFCIGIFAGSTEKLRDNHFNAIYAGNKDNPQTQTESPKPEKTTESPILEEQDAGIQEMINAIK